MVASDFGVVGVAFLAALAGTLVTSAVYEGRGILPYSRPHIEFENEEGKECVGWYLQGGGAVVALCEGQPPQIVVVKKKPQTPQGYSG